MQMYKFIDEIYDDYNNNYYSRPLYYISAYIYDSIKAIYYKLIRL